MEHMSYFVISGLDPETLSGKKKGVDRRVEWHLLSNKIYDILRCLYHKMSIASQIHVLNAMIQWLHAGFAIILLQPVVPSVDNRLFHIGSNMEYHLFYRCQAHSDKAPYTNQHRHSRFNSSHPKDSRRPIAIKWKRSKYLPLIVDEAIMVNTIIIRIFHVDVVIIRW